MNNLITGIPINDVSSSIQNELNPAIMWPTSNNYASYDSDVFPELTFVRQKYRKGMNTMFSPRFESATKFAENRIWVIDDYILDEDTNQEKKIMHLKKIFQKTIVNDIRFIVPKKVSTRKTADALELIVSEIRQKNEIRTDLKLAVKFFKTDKPSQAIVPHDRFAIVDNELWHFGATVAGFHNSLNAVTRGWSADLTRAADFFTDIWNSHNVC